MIALLIVLSLGFAAWLVKTIITNQHMKETVAREIIYEGIYVEDIHIGGLTKTEALGLLNTTITARFKNRELKILYEGDVDFKLPYEYFEFETDYKDLISKAYELGKIGTVKERYAQIKKMEKENIHYAIKEWYNDDKVGEFIDSIMEDYYVESQNATLEKSSDGFLIHDEVMGKAIDAEKSVSAINKGLVAGSDAIELVVLTKVPEVTKAFYEDIKDLISSFSTAFSANQEARNENLRVASTLINGTILRPDEIFSTNATIGPTDLEHGYQEAPIIIGGVLKKGFGGGVCQISTTLYNAAILSEIEIIERKNHSLVVGYIEKGRDATLAGDYIDFKFKNNTGFPIYIESYIKDYKIYMNIYGKETREENRTIKFETAVVKTIAPPPDKVTVDSSLKPLEEVVEKKAIVGYTVKLYKLIYIDNVLKDKVEVNTSYYSAYPAEVRRGPEPDKMKAVPVVQNPEQP